MTMNLKSIIIAAALAGGVSIGTFPMQEQLSSNSNSYIYILQQENQQEIQKDCNNKKWEGNKILDLKKLYQELNNILGNQQNNCTKPETNQPETNQPETSQPETNVEVPEMVNQVLELVNQERTKAGLSSLTLNVKACNAAQVRAKETQQSFSHTRPSGKSFSTALKEAGVSFLGAGENIAWGQKTAKAVMNAWMNSSGHRANILNAKYTQIGIGYALDATGTPYWTQLFFYE